MNSTPSHSNEVKRMSVQEFVELGFLQELNRQYLHPLGLAIEARCVLEGGVPVAVGLGGIWDYREDSEGIVFTDLTSEDVLKKAKTVAREFITHQQTREKKFGWTVQPIGDKRDE